MLPVCSSTRYFIKMIFGVEDRANSNLSLTAYTEDEAAAESMDTGSRKLGKLITDTNENEVRTN